MKQLAIIVCVCMHKEYHDTCMKVKGYLLAIAFVFPFI